jgi:hypothetical protein
MIFVYASFMKMPTEGSAASFSEGERPFPDFAASRFCGSDGRYCRGEQPAYAGYC